MDDTHYRTLRASIVTSALIGATLILSAGGAPAQGGAGMSDTKKMPAMNDSKKATTANGTGTITDLNAANHKVTLDHGPMPAIKWPAMKMEFAVAPSVDLAKLKTGDKVSFTLSGSGGTYTVQSISPAP
jgi:Cu(I)/Ag(I) efflux system protein CusF